MLKNFRSIRRITRFINRKTVAIFIMASFFVSLLPVIYCGFFDYANGDDLAGAYVAHSAFVNGVSFVEYFKQVFDATARKYMFSDGNYASTFVWFAFEPSIFHERLYILVPMFGFFCVGFCVIYTLFYFIKKYLKLDIWINLSLCFSIDFIILQYAPFIKPFLFWWTGMVSYIFPMGLLLLCLVWLDKYIETGKKCYLIWMSLAIIFIGGAGYFTILLLLEVFTIFYIASLFGKRKNIKKTGREKLAFLLIPYLLLIISFVINYIAPGNTNRAVIEGTSVEMSIGKAFDTIFDCIVQGGFEAMTRFLTIRPLIFLVILIILVVWLYVDVNSTNEKIITYKYPYLVLPVLFLIYCSIYAPIVFVGIQVSGGGPDDIYVVYILALCMSIAYLTGCIKKRYVKFSTSKMEPFLKKNIVCYFIFVVLLMLLTSKFMIKNSAWRMCSSFIQSGCLKDFYTQMEQRIELLSTDEMDVIIPQMNSEQGPFMHMPATEDPNNYGNVVLKQFYMKNSVVAIPRDEWENVKNLS